MYRVLAVKQIQDRHIHYIRIILEALEHIRSRLDCGLI